MCRQTNFFKSIQHTMTRQIFTKNFSISVYYRIQTNENDKANANKIQE